MNKLKPCPFCGSEAEIVTLDVWNANSPVGIGCSQCPAMLGEYCDYKQFDSEAKAIAAWNSRAERTCKPIIEPWESDKTKHDAYCGNCNYPLGDGELEPWNYCPNCGCKVVGE